MASISGICSSSPSLKLSKQSSKLSNLLCDESFAFPTRPKLDRSLTLMLVQSMSREAPAKLSKANDGAVLKDQRAFEKDLHALWRRYVHWLYHHKELGLYLNVSRVGFADEFIEQMEF